MDSSTLGANNSGYTYETLKIKIVELFSNDLFCFYHEFQIANNFIFQLNKISQLHLEIIVPKGKK